MVLITKLIVAYYDTFHHTGATPLRSIASSFGLGSGPIYLDNLICNSTERRLVDCRHNGIGTHNCGHSEDAGLRCLNSTTRTSYMQKASYALNEQPTKYLQQPCESQTLLPLQ